MPLHRIHRQLHASIHRTTKALRRKTASALLLAGLLSLMAPHAVWAQPAPPKFIVMASTTSTEQSGLFAHLLPQFTQASGIAVKVVAVGSGQAIDMARAAQARRPDDDEVHLRLATDLLATATSVIAREALFSRGAVQGHELAVRYQHWSKRQDEIPNPPPAPANSKSGRWVWQEESDTAEECW